MDDLRRPRRPSVSRAPAIALSVALAAFLAFSVWQVHGGAGLDHLAKRFTDWFMQGWVDAFVSSLGPLAEPEFATLAAVNFTATCSVCSGKGSSLHTLQDILNRIDALNP